MIRQDVRTIDNPRAYMRLLERLRGRRVREIALDFEGESNLHVYGLHLCLVQLFDGDECYLIDPMALGETRSVASLTENVEILKVMYDPASDLSLLTNSLGITVKNIFDLSTAAQVLGFRETSLTKVLEAELGVGSIDKKKFQRANWCRRPLDPGLLAYAAGDVIHLLRLKRVFLRRMVEQDLLSEFLIQNFKIQDRDYRIDPATRHLRLKNATRLTRAQQVYLKHFFEAREALARRLNWPPHNVLSNEKMIEIAKHPPDSRSRWQELGRRSGKRVELKGFAEAGLAAEEELRNRAGGHSVGRSSRGNRDEAG